jgi:hypothetical protein
MVFSTACDSDLNTSVVSKWRPFSFIFNRGNREKSDGAKSEEQGGWESSHVVFGQNSLVKKEV